MIISDEIKAIIKLDIQKFELFKHLINKILIQYFFL